MTEIWKDISEYPYYQASSLGRVRRIKSRSKNKTKILRLRLNTSGYNHICFSRSGKQFSKVTHRIIARLFVPNPDNKPQVNHINGIKTDNRAINLEWVTAKENIQHSFKLGLSSSRHCIGSKNHNSKLSEKDVLSIRANKNGKSDIELSKEFEVRKETIYNIIRRATWKHI